MELERLYDIHAIVTYPVIHIRCCFRYCLFYTQAIICIHIVTALNPFYSVNMK